MFYYGRPLWGLLLANNYPTILELAQEKLICSSDWLLVKDADKTFARLSIICSRTTLLLTCNSNFNSNLVSKFMSTLYYVNDDLSELNVRYISEPILAVAASLIM